MQAKAPKAKSGKNRQKLRRGMVWQSLEGRAASGFHGFGAAGFLFFLLYFFLFLFPRVVVCSDKKDYIYRADRKTVRNL